MDRKRRRVTCPECDRSAPEVLQDEHEQCEHNCGHCLDAIGSVHEVLYWWLAWARQAHPPPPHEEARRTNRRLTNWNDEETSDAITSPGTQDIDNIGEDRTLSVHSDHPAGAQHINGRAILGQEGIDNDSKYITEPHTPARRTSSSLNQPQVPHPTAETETAHLEEPGPDRSTAEVDNDPMIITSSEHQSPTPRRSSSAHRSQTLLPAVETPARIAWHTQGAGTRVHIMYRCPKFRGDWEEELGTLRICEQCAPHSALYRGQQVLISHQCLHLKETCPAFLHDQAQYVRQQRDQPDQRAQGSADIPTTRRSSSSTKPIQSYINKSICSSCGK
jgi:hypothetical protein